MSTRPRTPTVTVALPVYNGAETLAPVIESVLQQDHPDLELIISDNASTDLTEEIGRSFAKADERVVYHRHPTNVGLLNNFRSAAEMSRGSFVRWLGDDDSLEPEYVSRCLETFAEDERRVLVTTQMTYTDLDGTETWHADYDPAPLMSADPIERFAEMLTLLTRGFALLDPLYGMMRREVALLPRRNMLREDEIFAARLALAGPWGHVPEPLAHRHRSETAAATLVSLLDVPHWHRHAMDVLQCLDLLAWIGSSSLDAGQRRQARAQVLHLYGRRKLNKVRRGVAKAGRLGLRPADAPLGARS